MSKISVVIPHYGQREYLITAIESILNQTHQDFEILILNDDVESLKAFEFIDDRIKVYDRIDGARKTSEERLNLIIDELCEYWCYQDADGISYSTRLESSLRFLKETESDIITTDGIYSFRKFFLESPKYTKIDSSYGVGAMSSVFAKWTVLKKVPFTKYGYGSDGAWWWTIKNATTIKYDHLSVPTYQHLDYVSRFRKFKSIPILRKIYRRMFLKPQIDGHIRRLKKKHEAY